MKTSGPESEDTAPPAKAKRPQWRIICDIVNVLAIAYFVFLVVAILIAPEGTRNWAVFALHFIVTIALGYGARRLGDRYDKWHGKTPE